MSSFVAWRFTQVLSSRFRSGPSANLGAAEDERSRVREFDFDRRAQSGDVRLHFGRNAEPDDVGLHCLQEIHNHHRPVAAEFPAAEAGHE